MSIERGLIAAIVMVSIAWVARRAGGLVDADVILSPAPPKEEAAPIDIPKESPAPINTQKVAQAPISVREKTRAPLALPEEPPLATLDMPQAALTILHDRVLAAIRRNASESELRGIIDQPNLGHDARRYLANSVQSDAKDPRNQKTALYLACVYRSAGLVRVLLEAGADVRKGRLDEGTTPMHVAASWLHSEETLYTLLHHPNAVGDNCDVIMTKPSSGGLAHHTPVWWALHYRHQRSYEMLVDWYSGVCGQNLWYDVHLDEFTWHRTAEQVMEHQFRLRLETAARTRDNGRTSLLAELLRDMGIKPSMRRVNEQAEMMKAAGIKMMDAQVLADAYVAIRSDLLNSYEARREAKEEADDDMWRVMDPDGDGTIRKGREMDKLKVIVTSEGYSEEEYVDWIDALDADGDGEITRAEWQRWKDAGLDLKGFREGVL